MKKLLAIILGCILTGGFLSLPTLADTGGLSSLRGTTDLDSVPNAEEMKRVPKDRIAIERDYLHQPPVIPHQVRGYNVNLKGHKCLSCHSWKNYKKAGATKISLTHFDTRDGQQLSDVSPSRYFCDQCHVTQADAKPLVKSDFKSVDALTH
ncbi:MAG: nitrate reductase cytochrome c-type subunit [Halieaceae bacterium]|jgi:nitrate reductase (cytochrome), electron transfer subunit|nr:nitrate reductase cytochrome c-type subunit [Halieaceae bacterium]